MLASPAHAANGAAASGAGAFGLFSLLPWIAIFLIFYLLMIRPQQRRMKQHQAMIAAVKKNDVAVTAGGMIGKVVKVSDDGGGVRDGQEEAIFLPGTSGAGGSGLGLSLARRVARSVGGDVVLERAMGPTVFVVTLPMAPQGPHGSD